MEKNIRQLYKVEKDDIQQSFENQMCLKMNPEYEDWANNTAVNLIKHFLNNYNGVGIEIPKLREKSARSLLGKIKNLEIERLSKLYAVDSLSDEDKKMLYSLIKERIYENENIDKIGILRYVRELIVKDTIDTNNFEKIIMVDGISKSTKSALLKMYISKLEKKGLKTEIEKLDNKYGYGYALKTGFMEDDIIGYDCINRIRNNPKEIQKLKNVSHFLKANDLRGMKFVVTNIPDNFETKNPEIIKLLEKRKLSTSNEDIKLLNHQLVVEIGKDFYDNLSSNTQFLKENNMDVLEESRRHKKKKNGYEAEHIKFYNTKHPEYTLEVQFKSEYVEEIAMGEGSASHQNRPGKSRILPHARSNKELMQKLDFMVPKYTLFKIINSDEIEVHKQNQLRNTVSYFQKQIHVGSKLFEKLVKLYTNDNQNEKAI